MGAMLTPVSGASVLILKMALVPLFAFALTLAYWITKFLLQDTTSIRF